MKKVKKVEHKYNCISLRLTTAAVTAAISQKDLVATVLYCLALNHKQEMKMMSSCIPATLDYRSMKRNFGDHRYALAQMMKKVVLGLQL
ncbi:hypothetical protein REPUB_Repub11eG0069000 [Reevesia pubescens]